VSLLFVFIREKYLLYYENKFKEESIMSMTRGILNWTQEKYDKVIENIDTEKHPYAKSFGLGCIEGAIDGAIIAYPVLLAGCLIAAKKLKDLQK
jgi:hypothetical protein